MSLHYRQRGALSPAKSYIASPKLGMARPPYMPQSPRLMGLKQFTDGSATTRAGPTCEDSIWQPRCRHKWPCPPKCLHSLWLSPCRRRWQGENVGGQDLRSWQCGGLRKVGRFRVHVRVQRALPPNPAVCVAPVLTDASVDELQIGVHDRHQHHAEAPFIVPK